MAEDFFSILKSFVNNIGNIISNLSLDLEKGSFISLVECLKSRDEWAVKEAVDALLKENTKLIIPPLFLTSERHPNNNVRKYCKNIIMKMPEYNDIIQVTNNKEMNDAVNILIEKYGNYKFDY